MIIKEISLGKTINLEDFNEKRNIKFNTKGVTIISYSLKNKSDIGNGLRKDFIQKLVFDTLAEKEYNFNSLKISKNNKVNENNINEEEIAIEITLQEDAKEIQREYKIRRFFKTFNFKKPKEDSKKNEKPFAIVTYIENNIEINKKVIDEFYKYQIEIRNLLFKYQSDLPWPSIKDLLPFFIVQFIDLNNPFKINTKRNYLYNMLYRFILNVDNFRALINDEKYNKDIPNLYKFLKDKDSFKQKTKFDIKNFNPSTYKKDKISEENAIKKRLSESDKITLERLFKYKNIENEIRKISNQLTELQYKRNFYSNQIKELRKNLFQNFDIKSYFDKFGTDIQPSIKIEWEDYEKFHEELQNESISIFDDEIKKIIIKENKLSENLKEKISEREWIRKDGLKFESVNDTFYELIQNRKDIELIINEWNNLCKKEKSLSTIIKKIDNQYTNNSYDSDKNLNSIKERYDNIFEDIFNFNCKIKFDFLQFNNFPIEVLNIEMNRLRGEGIVEGIYFIFLFSLLEISNFRNNIPNFIFTDILGKSPKVEVHPILDYCIEKDYQLIITSLEENISDLTKENIRNKDKIKIIKIDEFNEFAIDINNILKI